MGSEREGRVEARVAKGSIADPFGFRIFCKTLFSQVLNPKPLNPKP